MFKGAMLVYLKKKVLIIFKGTVHSKMNILSFFTHPYVISNPYAVLHFGVFSSHTIALYGAPKGHSDGKNFSVFSQMFCFPSQTFTDIL